jgi:hypothetical protein
MDGRCDTSFATRSRFVHATTREHFIPVRKADLVDKLCREPGLSAASADEFRRLARLVEATFHFEYHTRLEELKNAYDAFNPDSDTRTAESLSSAQRGERLTRLFAAFTSLLERANFQRLSREQLLAALEGASDWGINLAVDLSVFDRLEIFCRGDVIGERTRRRWRNLWRLETVQLPVYQRLVVIFKLLPEMIKDARVDTDSVYVKFFKDIPKQDLEMLLPGTRFQMTRWEKGQIALPTLSGLAMTIFKIVSTALVLPVWGLLTLIGGTIGYGVKSYQGYLNTRQKYQLNLTQSLYYQNLDNNAGVLFRLLDEAEEQECREALLAYFLLWRGAGSDGWDQATLDHAAETWLKEKFGLDVDFEVDDALAKLVHLRVVEQPSPGAFAGAPINVALQRLDETWDGCFAYNLPEPTPA